VSRIIPDRSLEWGRSLSSASHWTVWVLVALAVAAIGWASVTKMQVYALVQGKLEPKGKLVTVDTGFGGRVLEVRVKAWDHVKKGDVLMVLDAAGVNAKESAAQLEKLGLDEREALQFLELARVDVAQQERLYGYQKLLYDAGAVARNDFETLRENLVRAKLTVQKTGTKLSAVWLETRRLKGQQRVVQSAPISGRVALIAAERSGEIVKAGSRVAEILPDGVPLVLRGVVSEADRPKLRLGAIAEVSWSAYPRQKYGFTAGRVTGIAPISAKDYEVLIGFQRLELRGESFGVRSLLPGMTAEARAIATTKTALAMLWDWVRGVNPWD